jgi:hypothetical protein
MLTATQQRAVDRFAKSLAITCLLPSMEQGQNLKPASAGFLLPQEPR